MCSHTVDQSQRDSNEDNNLARNFINPQPCAIRGARTPGVTIATREEHVVSCAADPISLLKHPRSRPNARNDCHNRYASYTRCARYYRRAARARRSCQGTRKDGFLNPSRGDCNLYARWTHWVIKRIPKECFLIKSPYKNHMRDDRTWLREITLPDESWERWKHAPVKPLNRNNPTRG